MRKIEKQIIIDIQNYYENYKPSDYTTTIKQHGSNTILEFCNRSIEIFLHGNSIINLYKEKDKIYILVDIHENKTKGIASNTTLSRINAILDTLANGLRLKRKNFKTYLCKYEKSKWIELKQIQPSKNDIN